MAENGIKTTFLDRASAIDSVIGNKDGSTSLVPLPDLARQLAGLGVEGTDEWLLAQKFAENPEDEPVLEGQFSALHHSRKSEASSLISQGAADTSTSQAALSTAQAAISASQAVVATVAGSDAITAAQLAAEVSGSTVFFDTYADAETALAGLSDMQVLSIFADETRGGSPTRYRVEAGVLVFKLDLGQFDRLMELDQRKPRKLWAKMFDMSKDKTGHVHWVGCGDSLASRKFVQFANELDRMLGAPNYSLGNYAGSNIGTLGGDQLYANTLVNATSVTSSYGIVPTGVYHDIGDGGSVKFLYAGANPSFTRLRFYYIKEPGAGVVSLKVNGVTVETADADQVTTELGILEYTLGSVSAAPGEVLVTSSGGSLKLWGGTKFNDDVRGLVKHHLLAQGGITPVQMTQNATVRLIHQQMIAACTPDIITLEMDDDFGDGGVNQDALDAMMDVWVAAAPYADKLLIGSTPRNDNDNGKRLANLRLREVAQSRGAAYLYFDSYKIMGTRAEMIAIFGSDDGVHPTARASDFAAQMLWNHLGLSNANLGKLHRPIVTPNEASSLYHGTDFRAGIGRLKFDSDNTFGYDWDMIFNRLFKFKSEAGVVTAQFSHNTFVAKNILPMGFDFGDGTGRSLSFTTGNTYQNSSINFRDTNMASGKLILDAHGVKHHAYTKATLPSFAPAFAGTIFYCSDGRADGQGCFVYANGQAGWRRLSDDTVVS